MSKDEEGGCKLSSACKHKERKPKKPHYIPRPWGKPYNYKCFQCPFTCMEKSHLYNHMKYSLCKNSLSLLIESDWSYKKSNFLIPEMHIVQEPQLDGSSERQEVCDSTGTKINKTRQVVQKASTNMAHFQDEEEEREENEEEVPGQGKKERAGSLEPLQINPCKSDANINMTGLKSKKERLVSEGEPEFIITNVFSLEGQSDKVKEDHRLSKVPIKPLNNEVGAQSEHWKLLSTSVKKSEPETQAGCAGANIIPCYPPSTYTDYQEHQGLSLLGINYPLNTSLFSYLSPSVSSSSAQLPFLASTAQLMQPSSQFQAFQNTVRSSFLPRFYYPLLFEHAFNTTEGKMVAGKPVSTTQVPGHLSFMPKSKMQVTPKICQHKCPESKSSISWGPRDKVTKQMSHHKLTQDEKVKWASQRARDILQHQKTSGSYIGPVSSIHGSSISQKKSEDGYFWADNSTVKYLKRKAWLQRDGQEATMSQMVLLDHHVQDLQNSNSCSPTATPLNVWNEKIPMMEQASCKRRRESEPSIDILARKSQNTSLLIGDLSMTLEEYGKVEMKRTNLASEDSGQQKALVEQLGKIRLELLHIHHTLGKTPCPYEGPLDLTVKRAEDVGMVGADKTVLGNVVTPPLSECPSKQLVKVELLPPELAICYVRPTKCEADSSVLPDGRIGGSGIVQTHMSIQDEGPSAGVNISFSKEQKQMCENV